LDAIAMEIGLRKQTCWSFKRKVKERLNSVTNNRKNQPKFEKIILCN
jgi:hypothetical protein